MQPEQARIMVVDDEPAIRFFLSEELKEAGYQVLTAASGKEALARLEQQPVDLVLLDQRMPGLDGLHTMELIRQLSLPPEVIILTAHATLDTAITAMRLGSDDFLIKPCDSDELLAAVKRGLERRQELLKRNAAAHLIAEAAHRLLQRSESQQDLETFEQTGPSTLVRCQDIVVDRFRQTVHKGSQPVDLTPTEYDLLLVFVDHVGQVLNYPDLAMHLSGHRSSAQQARDAYGTHLWRLRGKLGSNPNGEPYLANVRGRGYKLVDR